MSTRRSTVAEERDYHNMACVNLAPLVLLLMPYALLRHGWASWRTRRARRAGACRG